MQPSQQRILAQKAYEQHKTAITSAIMALAEEALVNPTVFEFIVEGDHIFQPFDVSQELSDYDAENGNEDDESEYMAAVWINVLLNSDEPALYLELMQGISNVQINGL